MKYDVFICHASEDKEEFVEPLIAALEGLGVTAWYDRDQIQLGDDFRQKMDDGLRSSRFGVVVLSPSFSKFWTEAEMSALFQQEWAFKGKRILPVLHNLTPKEAVTQWPILSARAAVASSEGPAEVAAHISAVVHKSPSPRKGAISRLYGVPDTRSVEFLGRDAELAQVEELLLQGGSVRIAAAIEGLPGIGKTELALQLVHRLALGGAFPGGIFWFDAENPDLLPTWGGPIADALGIPMGPTEERARQALLNVGRKGVATLLVLDNVEAWSDDFRPCPLPEGTHLRYLVTTRQRRFAGAQFKHVEVGVLAAPFARQLLDAVSGRKLAGAPGHEELVTYLDGHALAVELAGAFLGEYPAETPASYLTQLKANGAVEEEVRDLVRYQHTVTQAFETLWARLDGETRDAWRLAACFEPELVSRELTEAVGLERKPHARLRRLHLLEIDSEGRWWMHRLTREFGRRTGTEAELLIARQAFVEGCAAFANQIQLLDGPRLYLGNRVHLDCAVGLAPEVLKPEDARISRFQDRIATGLQSLGDLRKAKPLFEQVLASSLENFDETHPDVASSRSNLAVVLEDLGDLDGAKLLLEKALASNLESFGEAHPSVAISRSSLALVLQDLRDLERAKPLLEQALSSDLENFGEAHPSVASTRSNLASVLRNLGDLNGAKALLEKALSSDLENLGEAHPSVARSRSNLATVLWDLRDLEGAKALLEKGLASGLENLGEVHPEVTIRRSNLAMVLWGLRDLDGAKALLEKALSSGLENFGEAHPEVARIRSNLALVLEDLGDLEGAKAMAQKAVEIAALQTEGSLVRTQVEAAMKNIVGAQK